MFIKIILVFNFFLETFTFVCLKQVQQYRAKSLKWANHLSSNQSN